MESNNSMLASAATCSISNNQYISVENLRNWKLCAVCSAPRRSEIHYKICNSDWNIKGIKFMLQERADRWTKIYSPVKIVNLNPV